MSVLRKREGDNLEILEVEEILKNRGYSICLAASPEDLHPEQYIKRIYTSEFDCTPRDEIYQLLWLE